MKIRSICFRVVIVLFPLTLQAGWMDRLVNRVPFDPCQFEQADTDDLGKLYLEVGNEAMWRQRPSEELFIIGQQMRFNDKYVRPLTDFEKRWLESYSRWEKIDGK